MIIKAFAIRDTKADAYMQPFFCATNGMAVRAFKDGVNDDKSPFFKHPEDYVLFELGTYDDSSGVLSSLSSPVSLGVGIEYKEAV